MSDFELGEAVKLTSGGAEMTVKEVGLNDDKVRCVWHNSTNDGWVEQEGVYPSKALRKLQPRALGAVVSRG